MESQSKYDAPAVEEKWQRIWEENRVYSLDLRSSRKAFYTHSMFPYPSGDKLHVGHWYNFAPADTFARFKRMQGFGVFSPMGFDAFGLPAENYAIKTGIPPKVSISENIDTMVRQLKRIGCMYDWDHMVVTSSPEYYRWTQWLFLLMYQRGLAYKKDGVVPWCESCKTVLAREQVKEGECDRCSGHVSEKQMSQWYWKITDYAQRLLDDLKGLDWPDRTVTMQENWIGRSDGVTFTFSVKDMPIDFKVYDSVPQTFMAQTFVVIAPEHPLTLELANGTQQEQEVREFVEAIKAKKLIDKYSVQNETLGVFTGRYVRDPFGTGDLPIWVASYVVADYGTGIVSCSAHDERDFEFAKKYGIPLRTAMVPSDPSEAERVANLEYCYARAEEGLLSLPVEFSGRKWGETREEIIGYIEKHQIGTRSTQYRLRDWTISRQRYWGSPIPIVYDPEGNPHPVPEEHLPWKLPEDVDFVPTGVSPLAASKEFTERTERIFGPGWRPECDTMDTFVCSSFYSIRYLDPRNARQLCDQVLAEKWLPVDLYIGGAEHACMHLLYSRFVTKVLADSGVVSTLEPYKRLVHQGIITNNGAKMSKSKGNVVSPDSFVSQYGSDVFRIYLLFIGPYSEGADWSDSGINGASRFVQRAFSLFSRVSPEAESLTPEVDLEVQQTIQSVTQDYERLHFNTAVSSLMKLLNTLERIDFISQATAEVFAKLLAPIAPHLAEEVWAELLHNSGTIMDSSWPVADESVLDSARVEVPVMVNKKLCTRILVSKDVTDEQQEQIALSRPEVTSYLKERKLVVKRIIAKATRTVSIVAIEES